MLSGEREAVAATGSIVSTAEPYQDGTQPFKPAGDYKSWLSNRNPLLLGLLGGVPILKPHGWWVLPIPTAFAHAAEPPPKITLRGCS